MTDDDALFALYNRDLMALSSQVAAPKRLPAPDAAATAMSAICGSEVTIELAVENGCVKDVGYSIDACTLTKAVVAILVRALPGKSCADLAAAATALQAMLDGAAPAPEGDWAELKILLPVVDYKARHDTVMLPFAAAQKALGEIKKG